MLQKASKAGVISSRCFDAFPVSWIRSAVAVEWYFEIPLGQHGGQSLQARVSALPWSLLGTSPLIVGRVQQTPKMLLADEDSLYLQQTYMNCR